MKWLLVFALLAGCNSNARNQTSTGGTSGNGGEDMAVSEYDLAFEPLPTYDLLGLFDDGGMTTHDPVDCNEAAMLKSYIGCDYWPTVNANAVWSVFDFAVVISNPGMADAHVTVTGGALPSPGPGATTVPPGQLVKIGLPWVTALKGGDASSTGAAPTQTNSVFAAKGAYHLVSDTPVLVYQFNALEYKPGTGNDLNGTAWSTCPGTGKGGKPPCFSYSNDASLLLPSTAMTGNYFVTGIHGDTIQLGGVMLAGDGPHVAITGTADNTTVVVQLSSTAALLASTDGKVAAAAAGSKQTYMINAGDVLHLLAAQTGSKSDLTGTQIQADKPVQVISGHACATNPQVVQPQQYTCDHVEEVQLPFETWGKNYVTTAPTGPKGAPVQYTVRIYGGVTASTLTFTPSVTGAPAMIMPKSVVEFDTNSSFHVSGDNEFAIGVVQKSGQIVDPTPAAGQQQKGDPSLSFVSAVEQWRDRYIFLAPSDYDVNYADVVVPAGISLTLDGMPVTMTPGNVGAGYGVIRLTLATGANMGAHVLTGNLPFGIQVEGYGAYTSYQYPAGLDLKAITQPPPPVP
jgi:IgGFc binding protein